MDYTANTKGSFRWQPVQAQNSERRDEGERRITEASFSGSNTRESNYSHRSGEDTVKRVRPKHKNLGRDRGHDQWRARGESNSSSYISGTSDASFVDNNGNKNLDTEIHATTEARVNIHGTICASNSSTSKLEGGDNLDAQVVLNDSILSNEMRDKELESHSRFKGGNKSKIFDRERHWRSVESGKNSVREESPSYCEQSNGVSCTVESADQSIKSLFDQNIQRLGTLSVDGRVQRRHGSEKHKTKNGIVNLKEQVVPQLLQELVEKLRRGNIECMICYDIIGRAAAIWSCSGCYSIFHLNCIRKWAKAPTSSDLSAPRNVHEGNWRCPGCQAVQHIPATELKYECFCGEVVDPPVDHYLTPHSCGGPCKKGLDKTRTGNCKHVCTLQCHPGPCPPCLAFAPPQSCSCGKSSFVRRCSELNSESISCGKPCGLGQSCGRHFCENVCHEPPCELCSKILTAKCFCGRKVDMMKCGEISLKGAIDWTIGVFSCNGTCSKILSCGNHNCMESCHPGPCGDCKLSPTYQHTCPCGKKTLKELGNVRKSCLDPLPTCGLTCSRLLPCKKHSCQDKCHLGPCPPCIIPVEQRCRCGLSSRRVQCHMAQGSVDGEGAFLCERKCGKKKNCGRHRCNSRCCPAPGMDEFVADPHVCVLLCGKKLRCGRHTCNELCHTGHCPPCMESSFTELSCACGRTIIPPPVPCGTPLPSCEYPCSIPQACGHTATHPCHFGDCPPCSTPIAKECVGGHVIVRNVPCGSREIKCNNLCGKTRQCGLHACRRTCHLPPCDTSGEAESRPSDQRGTRLSCGQPCGAPRRDCSHPCPAACHPFQPCPESRCKALVLIACGCGRLSGQVPCDVGNGGGDAIFEAMILAKLPSALQPTEGKEHIPFSQQRLLCDSECLKTQKLHILADAFGVMGTGHDNGMLDDATGASDSLHEIRRKDPQFVVAVEDRFRYMLLGPKKTGSMQMHVFCPLPKEKRELVYILAERWKLLVKGVGREPERFLVAHTCSKTRVPSHGLVSKSPLPPPGRAVPQNFDSYVDMDPRRIIALLDLPGEADVSNLILRFGGECELVWLNDKNAIAIFMDPVRAATALRKVDHASVYEGAVAFSLSHGVRHSASGPSSTMSFAGVTQKMLPKASVWAEDAWGDNLVAWQPKDVPIPVGNPWKPLVETGKIEEGSSKLAEFRSCSGAPAGAAAPVLPPSQNEELDDWEKAFD